MFSGSFDFNSTFAQLTSSLTLDALQDKEKEEQKEKDKEHQQRSDPLCALSEDSASRDGGSKETTTQSGPSIGGSISLEQHLEELTRMKEFSKEQQSKYVSRIKELEGIASDKDMEIKELRRIVRQYEGRVLEAEDEKEALTIRLQEREGEMNKYFTKVQSLQEQLESTLLELKKEEERCQQLESERYECRQTTDEPISRSDESAVPMTPMTPSSKASGIVTVDAITPEPLTPSQPQASMDDALNAVVTPLKKSNEELEKKLKKYQKRIKDLDSEIKRLTDAQGDNERRFNESIADKDHQLLARDENIQSLTHRLEALEKEKDSSQNARDKIAKELADLKEVSEREKENLVSTYESTLSQLKTELNRYEMQVKTLTESHTTEEAKVIATFQQQMRELENEYKNMSIELRASETNLSRVKEERDTVSEHFNRVKQENLQLKGELEKKIDQFKDSEGKVSSLADKLKDLMQRYAEVKSKYGQLEAQIETTKVDSEKQFNTKETEVIKAQLKLERVEQQLDDFKSKFSELSEKYAEAQRHLTEIKTSHAHLVEEHQLCGDLKRELEQVTDEKETLIRERELAIKRVTDSFQLKLTQTEQQLQEISANYQILFEQSKHNIESGEVLEDYKKRAQLAIKKANASVLKLTEENEKLVSSVTNLNQLYEEQRSRIEDLTKEKASLMEELEDMKIEVDGAKTFHSGELESARRKIQDLEQNLEYKERELGSILLLHQQQQQQLLHQSSSQPIALDTLLESEDQETQSRTEDQIVASPTLPQSSPMPIIIPSSIGTPISSLPSDEKFVVVSPVSPISDGSVVSKSNVEVGKAEVHNSVTNRTVPKTSSNSNFMLVNELQHQLNELKKDLSKRGIELEEANHQLLAEREEKSKLIARCDELMAYLARLKKSHEGDPNAAVNLEYLKNCVFKYMSTNESSERKRLFRVIGTILNFTARELKQIEDCINEAEQAATQVNQAISSIGSSLEGWFGTKW